jgi:hypothetical protein
MSLPHPVRIIASQFVQHVVANRFSAADNLAQENTQWMSEWLSSALLESSDDRTHLSPSHFAAAVGICREMESCVASSLAHRHLLNPTGSGSLIQNQNYDPSLGVKSLKRTAAIISAYLGPSNGPFHKDNGQATTAADAYHSAINDAWEYASNFTHQQRSDANVWNQKLRKFSETYGRELSDIVNKEEDGDNRASSLPHYQSIEADIPTKNTTPPSKKRKVSQMTQADDSWAVGSSNTAAKKASDNTPPPVRPSSQQTSSAVQKKRKGDSQPQIASIRDEGSLAWNHVSRSLDEDITPQKGGNLAWQESKSRSTSISTGQRKSGDGQDQGKAKSARKDKAPGTGCVKLRHLMLAGLLAVNDKLKAFPKETHAVSREAYIISECGELYDDGEGLPFNSVSAWLKQVQVFYKKNSNSSFSCWQNVAVWREENWRMLSELLHEYRKREAQSSAAQGHFSKLQFKPTHPDLN